MKKSFFIVFLIALGLIALTFYLGSGSIYAFLNIPSIMISVFISLLLCLGTFSPSEIVGYISIALRNDKSDAKKIKNGIHFFCLFQSYLIISAAFGFITGLVMIGFHLTDPDALAPGLGVAMLVILYSLTVILLITTPFKSGLRRMLEEME